MGIKILMGCICILPMMFIMWIMMYFEGKQKGNIIFGVTLWENALQNDEVKRIQKNYKRNLLIISILLIVMFAICCIPSRDSVVMTGFLIMILLMIFIYFVPFAMANKQIRQIKIENKPLQEDIKMTAIETVDMTAAAKKDIVMFKKTAILGGVIGIIPLILEAVTGENEDMEWVNLTIMATISAVGLLLCFLTFYFGKMKTEVVSKNSLLNIQLGRVKKYQWSKASAICIWLNTVYTFYLFFTMRKSWGDGTTFIIVTMIYAMVLVSTMIVAEINTTKIQNKYTDLYSYDNQDEDANWLWGMIYYNKNDNRFMVNKRVGVGTTINMAKKSSKIFMVIMLVIMFASIVGSSIWMLMIDFTPVSLEIDGNHLISSHLGVEYDISIEDITNLQFIEEFPDLSKRRGTGMNTIKKGSFEEWRREKCEVCVRINGGAYIRIETKDEVYYLNDESADKTVKIHEQIKESMN